MAIAQSSLTSTVPPHPMTYEDYMAEPTFEDRYDIIDGIRAEVGTTEEHQDIVGNLYRMFYAYQQTSGAGKVIIAPRDVLISRTPLRTRQPDVLFITYARHAPNPPRNSGQPMTMAPELVVEVLSDSDRARVIAGKIADYQHVAVREGWIVRPLEQTVEVLLLTPAAVTSAATYQAGQSVHSLTFPDLIVPVNDIFAE